MKSDAENAKVVAALQANWRAERETALVYRDLAANEADEKRRGILLRMAEAGMGPASFLMPEDLTIAGRNQLGLTARATPWLLLGRGLNRETVDPEGRTVSHVTDETTNRGFWRHLRAVMTES